MDVNKVANQPTINGKPIFAYSAEGKSTIEDIFSEKVIILGFTEDDSAIIVNKFGHMDKVTILSLIIELDEETKSLLKGQEENNGNY